MRRCVVLHQEVARDAAADEQDTLAAAEAVAAALPAAGFVVERVALGLDLRPFLARIRSHPPDLIFNLVESLPSLRFSGPAGLAAAALLEGSGIPFTGSRLAALALSTDKPAAKRVLRRAGVPIAPDADDGWPGPFIVKHKTEHASFGLEPSAVCAELPRMLPEGWFAEAFVPGREFNLSLLEEEEEVVVLPPAELVYASDWPPGVPRILGYTGKWQTDDPSFFATRRVSGGIDAHLGAILASVAMRAFESLGLQGYGRVDIRLDAAGTPRVLDVNANPALAPDAGFAAAAAAAHLSYEALIARIVDAALRDAHRPARRRSPPRAAGPPPGDVHLRTKLRAGDAAVIEGIVESSGFFNLAEQGVAAELVAAGLAHGDASGYRFIVAEAPSGHLLGYACFGPVPATEGGWDLYWIVVRADARGKGIGRRLLEAVASAALGAGGERLYAETSGRPSYAPTRRFYAAVGFTLQGVLPDYYARGDAKQIWMRPIASSGRSPLPA